MQQERRVHFDQRLIALLRNQSESIALVWCEVDASKRCDERGVLARVEAEAEPEAFEVKREAELRRCLKQLRDESEGWHARGLRRLQLQLCEGQRCDQMRQQRIDTEAAAGEGEGMQLREAAESSPQRVERHIIARIEIDPVKLQRL